MRFRIERFNEHFVKFFLNAIVVVIYNVGYVVIFVHKNQLNVIKINYLININEILVIPMQLNRLKLHHDELFRFPVMSLEKSRVEPMDSKVLFRQHLEHRTVSDWLFRLLNLHQIQFVLFQKRKFKPTQLLKIQRQLKFNLEQKR